MGRRGSGIEIRPASIRVSFIWEGKTRWERLVTNGKAMAPTLPNIRYAERLAASIKAKIALGTFSLAEFFPASADASSGEQLTLGRQMTAWLDARRLEVSTAAGYSSATKFWARAVVDGVPLGDRPLRAIKHSELLRGLATKPLLSGKTVNNYVSVLREAIELAVTDGILTSNPAATIPRAAWQREPPDPFDLAEAELIIADLLAHYPEPIGNHVQWRFFTGVRTSEAAGLQWPSVDLASEYFQVREAIVRGVAKSNTKTSVARNVLLNSTALAALQRQAKHTRIAGAHVWLDPRYGTPWLEERAFRRSYWAPCLKRLGVRYRPPNNMRHTYATMMLMAGRTPGWCAKQLGHSVEMFLRTYSKWISGAQDVREMDGLEAWLAGSRTADSSQILPTIQTKSAK